MWRTLSRSRYTSSGGLLAQAISAYSESQTIPFPNIQFLDIYEGDGESLAFK